MRFDAQLQYTPAIVLTASDDPETKLKALEIGATDFLRKPVDRSELVLRRRNTLTAKAYEDFLAFFDRTTGLVNRQRFQAELQERAHGCDECQGYFFSKPVPATEFAGKYLKTA